MSFAGSRPPQRASIGEGKQRQPTSRSKDKEGEVMIAATRTVVTAPPTLPVIDALRLMVKRGFRRLPIIQPGDRRLTGIVTATDLVNYFGGGRYFNIISAKFKGDYYKALNEQIDVISSRNVVSFPQDGNVSDALTTMVLKGVGSLPLVNHQDQVTGIITERDLVHYLAGKLTGSRVKDLMSSPVVSLGPNSTILDVVKLMVSRKIRRVPVVEHEDLLGIVTTLDILRYVSSREAFSRLQSGKATDVLSSRISDFMTRQLMTIDPETEVGQAAELMTRNRIGALPVCSAGKMIGIVTERDFFKILAAE